MITAIQKYVCIQTRAKRKNENSCVRIARLWVNYFSFVSFPLLWLEHFILWNKEKSRGVYAAAQLTFKGWIRNLRNQYANSGHVQYLARVSILCFAWSLQSHLSASEAGWWAIGCSEKQNDLPKSVWGYKWQRQDETSHQFCSKAPAHPVYFCHYFQAPFHHWEIVFPP